MATYDPSLLILADLVGLEMAMAASLVLNCFAVYIVMIIENRRCPCELVMGRLLRHQVASIFRCFIVCVLDRLVLPFIRMFSCC